MSKWRSSRDRDVRLHRKEGRDGDDGSRIVPTFDCCHRDLKGQAMMDSALQILASRCSNPDTSFCPGLDITSNFHS